MRDTTEAQLKKMASIQDLGGIIGLLKKLENLQFEKHGLKLMPSKNMHMDGEHPKVRFLQID